MSLTIQIAAVWGKILCARCSLFKHSNHPANPPLPKVRKWLAPSPYPLARVFVTANSPPVRQLCFETQASAATSTSILQQCRFDANIPTYNIATYLDAIETSLSACRSGLGWSSNEAQFRVQPSAEKENIAQEFEIIPSDSPRINCPPLCGRTPGSQAATGPI
ncbi:hypothetical protein FA15DRAFT_662096 [Coprinopsis marcescibilis]|uniref:Uncharacterized protein n=1 Tax=Coprinopsis marcescibilis TaxID=230819 RepID=A0A5C3KA77_COPMA|nr:hypothetical protein FA15DRAFT_662096 [Coprinopsis marcescibilis]